MQFNFKDLSQDDFVYWMFINLLDSKNKPQWDEIQERTSNYTDVNITMQINGIDVNCSSFIELIRRSLESRAVEEAKELITEALPDLTRLQDELDALDNAIRDKVNQWARENNIDIDVYRD